MIENAEGSSGQGKAHLIFEAGDVFADPQAPMVAELQKAMDNGCVFPLRYGNDGPKIGTARITEITERGVIASVEVDQDLFGPGITEIENEEGSSAPASQSQREGLAATIPTIYLDRSIERYDIADAILESDWYATMRREAKAEGWGEGALAGVEAGRKPGRARPGRNPYHA